MYIHTFTILHSSSYACGRQDAENQTQRWSCLHSVKCETAWNLFFLFTCMFSYRSRWPDSSCCTMAGRPLLYYSSHTKCFHSSYILYVVCLITKFSWWVHQNMDFVIWSQWSKFGNKFCFCFLCDIRDWKKSASERATSLLSLWSEWHHDHGQGCVSHVWRLELWCDSKCIRTYNHN